MKEKWKKLFLPMLSVGAAFALGAGVGALDVQTQSANAVEPASVSTADFFVRSVALRIADDDYGAGVRYKVVMKKSVFETNYEKNGKIKENVETGLLLVASDALGNETLTMENAAVAADTTGEWYSVTYDSVEYMESVVYVYNIAEENYADNIIVRAYAKEGTTIEYSAQSGGVSLAEVATEAYGMDSSIATSLKDTYCKFTLTYYSGTNQDGTPIQYGNTQTVYWGDKLTEPTTPTHPTNSDAAFEGWYNEAGTVSWDFENTKVLGNTRLFAKFSYDCLVTLDTVGGTLPASYVALEKGKYVVRYSGGGIDLPTPFKANCKFEGWYKNAAYTGSKIDAESFTCADNLTLYAKWSSVGYVYMHYGEAGSKFLRLEYPIGTELTLNELVEEFKQTLSVEDVPGYEKYCLGTNIAVKFEYWGVEDGTTHEAFIPAPQNYVVSQEDVVLVATYKEPVDAYLKYDAVNKTYTKIAGGAASYQIGDASTPYGTYSMTITYKKGGFGGGHGPALRMYSPQADFQHESGARYLAVGITSSGLQVSKVNKDESPVWAHMTGSVVSHASIGSAWNTYYTSLTDDATVKIKLSVESSSVAFNVNFAFHNGTEWVNLGRVYTFTDSAFLLKYVDTGWGIRSTGNDVKDVVFSDISFVENKDDKVVKFMVDNTCYSVAAVDAATSKVVLPTVAPTKDGVTKANGNIVSYAFDGWYLGDGTKVTANTTFKNSENVYAKFAETEMRNGMVVTYDDKGNAQYFIATTSAGSTSNYNGTRLDGLTADFTTASEYEYSFTIKYTNWVKSTGAVNFRSSIFLNSKGIYYNNVSGEGSIWANFHNNAIIFGSKVDGSSVNTYEVGFSSMSADCTFLQYYKGTKDGDSPEFTITYRYGVTAQNKGWVKLYANGCLLYTYGLTADSQTHTTSDGKTLNKVDGEIVWCKVCTPSNQNKTDNNFDSYVNNTNAVARGSDVGIWAWGNNSVHGGVMVTNVYNKPINN